MPVTQALAGCSSCERSVLSAPLPVTTAKRVLGPTSGATDMSGSPGAFTSVCQAEAGRRRPGSGSATASVAAGAAVAVTAALATADGLASGVVAFVAFGVTGDVGFSAVGLASDPGGRAVAATAVASGPPAGGPERHCRARRQPALDRHSSNSAAVVVQATGRVMAGLLVV